MATRERKTPKKTRVRSPRGTMHGKPIVDAKKPLIVSITKADIKGAKTGNPEECGAARAICREEKAIAAYVHRGVTLIEREKVVERYMTPKRLRDETMSFDRGASDAYLEGDYRLLAPTGNSKLGSDHRPSDRGGGSDKSHAGKNYPKYAVKGARPVMTEHRS